MSTDVEEIKSRMLALARDDRVCCAALLRLASELDVSPRRIGELADELGLKISGCQLGCFP